MPPGCGTGMHRYLVISVLSLLTAVLNKFITSWAHSRLLTAVSSGVTLFQTTDWYYLAVNRCKGRSWLRILH